MNPTDTIQLIKESFESWYNKTFAQKSPVSVVINYSDVQTLAIKAYHTIKMEVVAVSTMNGQSQVAPLLVLQENYNHGVTTEQEAKEGLTKKMLMAMYGYRQ